MENENLTETEEIVEDGVDNASDGGKKRSCCICKADVDSESAAMLAVNALAQPRYLCPECESDMADAMGATTPERIAEAMDRISRKLTENDIEDSVTLNALDEIMSDASDRAEAIKDGTYDFSLDEVVIDEVPEELLETEEDKELDRKEEERNKKIDKIFDWISFALIFAFVAFAAYWIIVNFFA